MQIRIRNAVCAVVVLTVIGPASAAVPSSVAVQGKLTDASGIPLSAGSKTFTFRIFDDSVGGTPVWPGPAGEIQSIASDANGLWVGLVGALSPLTPAVFSDNLLWLEINVNGTTLPRTQFLTGPYAFRVATVDGATGGLISGNLGIGSENSITANGALVVGLDNVVSGNLATVAGGFANTASGEKSFIGSGQANTADDSTTVVAGGRDNISSGKYSAVLGGQGNHARGNFSFVGGGGGSASLDTNSASGVQSGVVGGRGNVASGQLDFVGGGANNFASGGGGAGVLAGNKNEASGLISTVCGGRSGKARGSMSFVGGGGQPNATPGDSNVASGISSGVVCGIGNRAGDSCAFVGAGRDNDATGRHSAIPGGLLNAATGDYSFAAGHRAKSNHTGTFVWGDSTNSDFASTGINQFLIHASGGVGIGTNDPEGPLHVLESAVGGATANVASTAIFERNSANYVSILGLDGSPKGILFGDASDVQHGGLIFDDVLNNGLEFRTGGNVTRMSLDASGNLTVDGCVEGNNTACASDRRLKTKIATLNDALATVRRLRGVSYEWNRAEFPARNFESGTQTGVIAQEVQEVLPGSVRERADGYLGVEYNSLIPVLIEAIKEQQKQIEDLRSRLDRQTP